MLTKKIVANIRMAFLGGTCAAAIMFAPVVSEKVLSDAGFNISLGTQALAQNQRRKPRKLPGIGQKVNDQLNKIAEYITPTQEEGKPEKQPNIAAAEKLLKKLERDCNKKEAQGKKACNGNELGNIYRFMGVAAFQRDDLKQTAINFEKIIEQSPEIPLALEESILLQLAKILASEEEYKKAIVYLDKYINLVSIIPPDAYYTKSTICYQMDDLNCALTNVNKAVKLKEDADLVPKEQWYNLQRGIYNQREDYKNSIVVNKKLIKHYPKAAYWNDLGAFHGLMENFDKNMYVLDAGRASKILDSENQFLQLAQLMYQQDAPFNAASVMEEGFKGKYIEESEKNLERIGRYFYAAKEFKKAIEYLTRAGAKAESGDIYADVVGIYVQLEDMNGAIAMAKKALAKKGGLKKPGRLHFQMGSAYFELKQYTNAIAAFEKSANYKPTKTVAEQWIQYSERQRSRYEQLEKFLNS